MIRRPPRSTLFPYTTLFRSPRSLLRSKVDKTRLPSGLPSLSASRVAFGVGHGKNSFPFVTLSHFCCDFVSQKGVKAKLSLDCNEDEEDKEEDNKHGVTLTPSLTEVSTKKSSRRRPKARSTAQHSTAQHNTTQQNKRRHHETQQKHKHTSQRSRRRQPSRACKMQARPKSRAERLSAFRKARDKTLRRN